MNSSGQRATGLLPKDCPFRGSSPKVNDYQNPGKYGGEPMDHGADVACTGIDCHAYHYGHTVEEAIRKWNRRANRWSAFSDEELKKIVMNMSSGFRDEEGCWHDNEMGLQLKKEIWLEIERRQATGEGEK